MVPKVYALSGRYLDCLRFFVTLFPMFIPQLCSGGFKSIKTLQAFDGTVQSRKNFGKYAHIHALALILNFTCGNEIWQALYLMVMSCRQSGSPIVLIIYL